MLPTRQPAQFIILCCFHAAHWIQNVPAVHCKPPTVGIMEPMHVEGAEARPWSDRHLSDHLPSGTVPEIRDFQPLSRIQTRLGGSVEDAQRRTKAEKESKSLREQLATYIEAIRPRNPKLKLFQIKRIDTIDPMEHTRKLVEYAEQLQLIHKRLPTSPKDRMVFKWTDNPVMFDGRELPRAPVPARGSMLEKSKTMDTRVERMMGKLSIKIPSFKAIGSQTRFVKSDPLQEVSKVPLSSSGSSLLERIAPIPLTPGTLSSDPLDRIMNMVAQDKLRSLHDLLDKILPLETARKSTGSDEEHYTSLVLQRFVFRTVQFMYEHGLISSDHLKSFFAMKDTIPLATINVRRSAKASWLTSFRYSELHALRYSKLHALGFCYSEKFADFVDEGDNLTFFRLKSSTKSGTAIQMVKPENGLEKFQRVALLLASSLTMSHTKAVATLNHTFLITTLVLHGRTLNKMLPPYGLSQLKPTRRKVFTSP
ncbi:hypothetical protein H4Q26_002212 [Puccinia striiformis f. sp. tritici PST-130]|nr:hypothetical protein H4Q26_002212 [Puccinia striiformis f. sp. tritici PST-130]